MIPVETNIYAASDIEANNLLPYVTQLWCLVSIDIATDKLYLFHNYPEYDNVVVHDPFDNKDYQIPARTGTFDEGVEWWKRIANDPYGKLVVHNCLGYDKPVLEKFYPNFITPLDGWLDTLVRSKMQFYERPIPKGARGAHGLQAYGCRFGVFKPEVKDWSTMDAFKLHRCIEDCNIQKRTYLYLERERQQLKERCHVDMSDAYDIDNYYAYKASQQELNGALLDVDHYNNCLVDLDGKILTAQKDIEPQLPKTINKPPKIANSELARKLNLPNADKVVDRMVERKRNGETYMSPVKVYSNPTPVFTVKKGKAYNAFNISYGTTPNFSTIKALRGYITDNYPQTIFKYPDKKGTSDWIVDVFEDEVRTVNKSLADWYGIDENDVDLFGDTGFVTKVSFEDTKLTQQDQVKSFLVSLGWEPEEWNVKKDSNKQVVRSEEEFDFYYPPLAVNGHRAKIHIKKGQPIPTTPKLTESSYESLPEGLGKKIANYNTYQHRRRFIKNPEDDSKGLLNSFMANGRCPCGLNVFATATGRSSQSVWVNSPGKKSLYGKEIRQGLICGEHRKLVGSDMKSAQLSIAAYYAKNWEYFDSIINGEQFKLDEYGDKIINPATGHPFYLGESGHCVSSRAFGIVTDEEWQRAVKTQDWDLIEELDLKRSYSKGASFACLPVDNTYVYAKENGWVQYDDLYVGMEILAYNPETKMNEFTPIQHIVSFDGKEVIEMGNNEWKFESTTDHRWLGLRRTANNGKHWEVEEFIKTQDIKSEFKIYNSATRDDTVINSIITENEAAILAWILSDGYVEWSPASDAPATSHGRLRGCRAVITQAHKKYIHELESLLTKEGALQSISDRDNILMDGTNSPIRTFRLKSEYIRYLWNKLGFSKGKKYDITSEEFHKFICENDNSVLHAFLDAFILADGYVNKRGYTKITQNEGNILELIKNICVILGINYSVRFNGDTILSNKRCYSILLREKSYTGSTKLTKTNKGVRKTFCVTTKFSTFVAKQGEIVTITGNCIFGASGAKIANILGVSEKEGAARKQSYLDRIGLEGVIKYLQASVKAHPRMNGGYIPLPMGYWVFCNMPHKLFNYLDQGTEAVCQKLSVNRFNHWLDKETAAGNIDAMKILDIHDEFLVDSHEDCAHEVGVKMCECYKYASDLVFEWHNDHPDLFPNDGVPAFAFNLDGGFDMGDNYYDVH